jgi:hypothetical protein
MVPKLEVGISVSEIQMKIEAKRDVSNVAVLIINKAHAMLLMASAVLPALTGVEELRRPRTYVCVLALSIQMNAQERVVSSTSK